MRRTIAILFVTFLTMTQVPAFAAESTTASEKDLCLLYSEKCANQTLTIQEKIARLRGEIEKGENVYDPAELQRLQDKLVDAEQLLDTLLSGNGGHGHGHGHR